MTPGGPLGLKFCERRLLRGLKRLLRGYGLIDDRTDRLANQRADVERGARQHPASTGEKRISQSGGNAQRAVEQRDGQQHVIVEEASARTNRRPAVLEWIPRNAELRREIEIRLRRAVAQSWLQLVQHGDRREVAIRASCHTVVSQRHGD